MPGMASSSSVERLRALLSANPLPALRTPEAQVASGASDPAAARLHREALTRARQEHLGRLRQFASEHAGVIAELCDVYVRGSDEERAAMRALAGESRDWREILGGWSPPRGPDDPPIRRLELMLAAMSLADSLPDYRDTLLALTALWDGAERSGVSPEHVFSAAVGWGGELAHLVRLVLSPSGRAAYRMDGVQPRVKRSRR